MPTARRYRDDSTSASQIAGAVAGGIAGVFVGLALAQTFGGVSGIVARFRRVVEDLDLPLLAVDGVADDADDAEEDGDAAAAIDDVLGERVLAAFQNDPVLVERAIDIEVRPEGTIELSGAVDTDREVTYAATLAGGVPGVRRVMTRLGVKERGWLPPGA